jgi:hypothetical protein
MLGPSIIEAMSEFVIDFGSPESVAAAIPTVGAELAKTERRDGAAREALDRAAQEARAADKQLERTRALLSMLEKMSELDGTAGDGAKESSAAADTSSKERALQVVTAINGPTASPR